MYVNISLGAMKLQLILFFHILLNVNANEQYAENVSFISPGSTLIFEKKYSDAISENCQYMYLEFIELHQESSQPVSSFFMSSIVTRLKILLNWTRPSDKKLNGKSRNSSISLSDLIIDDQNDNIYLKNVSIFNFPRQNEKSVAEPTKSNCYRVFKTIYQVNSNKTIIRGKIASNNESTDFTLTYHNLTLCQKQIKVVQEDAKIFTHFTKTELHFNNFSIQLQKEIKLNPEKISKAIFNNLININPIENLIEIEKSQEKKIIALYRQNILFQISELIKKFIFAQYQSSYQVPSKHLLNTNLEQLKISGLIQFESISSKMHTIQQKQSFSVKLTFSLNFEKNDTLMTFTERDKFQMMTVILKKLEVRIELISWPNTGENSNFNLQNVYFRVEEKFSPGFQKYKSTINTLLSGVLEEKALMWFLYSLE